MRKLTLMLLCFSIFSASYAQEQRVSGKVLDAETGTSMPGVSVLVKNTTRGVVTDVDGQYTINVDPSSTLIFSFIGYETLETQVGNRTSLDVTLTPSISELQEIVVVAYGNKKKADVTSSVTSIDGGELTDVTSPDVSTMLQGKAAGVQVVTGSGQPGSMPVIRIRGIASLNGNVDPLWVVDGAIYHGTPNLNPNEIQSISVLKDASATALYGSRGANGVIVVTTTQAETGKSKLSLSTRTGYSYFNQGNFEVMNSAQLYDYYGQFANPSSIPTEITDDVLKTDFNWIENGTQTGVVQDHTLAFSAGTDKSKTFISLGYYDETGTVKGYEYDRLSFRLNHDYNVSERLTLKPKIAANYSKRDNKQHSLYQMYTNLPWDAAYEEDGTIINPQDQGVTWYGRDRSNYLYDLQWNYSEGTSFNLFSNFDVEFDILQNLTFISTNNITLYGSDSKSYTDPASNSGEANNGELYTYSAKRITRFTNQMLRYSKSFGSHNLNALVAYEYNDYVFEDLGATGYGIISGTEILNNAAKPADVNGFKNDYALQSFLFNTDYSYDNRYLAQFSIRRDGASNFGRNNQYGTFYSFSAGWNIHNEAFFDVAAINSLKLRGSYGAVGNRPSSLYPQYDLYNLSNTYNGAPVTTPSQLGNDDLSWEKSYQTNIGIDAFLFERVNFSVEYYNKNTSDLLYFVTLPSASGYTGYWENIGGVKNTGIETMASVDIFKDGDFTWNVGFNIGSNNNEITELYEDQEIDRGRNVSRVGEDFNSWFLNKWLGVDPETGAPLWEVVDPETGEVSETTDWNEATKQIVGTSSPDFYGGFNTRLGYKGLTLSANFAFSKGGKIYNASRELYDSDGAYPTYNQQVLADDWSRWEKPGDQATHPQAFYGGNNLSNKTSSRYLEDGSFLRMRNIRLGYTLPTGLISKLKMSTAEIYVSGDNLLTFTKFTGMDPEVGIEGVYSNLYPVSRRVAVGLNISF
ncbi:SusC/RagA family TonB-linked outer membrane protein [Fulvivirga kasyanovii]|uniref:TonB-dependent receptor n=1 Tax=Fulvivirga kasyanovii TaxID=396812 RepID=A0ABW9RU07_9BACT|nr:TonB-dependent receptor [Fulvivirga kasyanovii]MTI27674.1 TonB-dependent receptor [Fulvivirga kasyanovii]